MANRYYIVHLEQNGIPFLATMAFEDEPEETIAAVMAHYPDHKETSKEDYQVVADAISASPLHARYYAPSLSGQEHDDVN